MNRFFTYLILLSLLCVFSLKLWAQSEIHVYGQIRDEMHQPVSYVNITESDSRQGTTSDKSGRYSLRIPYREKISLRFSYLGYRAVDSTVFMNGRTELELNLIMQPAINQLPTVSIQDKLERKNSITRLDPKLIKQLPGASGFEEILQTLPGVSSSSELSSRYNVRGGNFDENLVYVNDILIYRPFLVSSGKQEGLSFLNTDMVSSVIFSAGGFDAIYGDKMSSVLDIRYKKPSEFGASFSAGLLGGSLHLEGCSDNYRFRHITGIRYKSNKYLLTSTDTRGRYEPNFSDIQTYMTYDISDEFELGFLGQFSRNTFNFIPVERETTLGNLNESYNLTVYFEGQEQDRYTTATTAFSGTYSPSQDLVMKFIASGFTTSEKESYDILGEYYLNELESDLGSEDLGDSVGNVGIGTFLNHARNYLNANVLQAKHIGDYRHETQRLRWGFTYQIEDINFSLHEWQMIDSAGYSLPYSDEFVHLQFTDTAMFDIYSNRLKAFIQDDIDISTDSTDITLKAGVRFNYWDYNNEFLVSPRVGISYDPKWENDWIFRLSGGWYHQPAFFKEFIRLDGSLNENIKAQSSIHAVLGGDYVFTAWGRPFKLITELYYKYMYNLIPYEINDLSIRYYGENMAKGYSTGIDFKLNGEFVKGTESWFSLSLMQAREDIEGDAYYEYYDDSGDVINPSYTTAVDSSFIEPGYIPRPADQLLSASVFFQDYVPGNPTIKANLKLVFGTGLPFGAPHEERYLATARFPAYRRVDIGFSKQIIGASSSFSEGNPLRYIKDFWVSLEVFNLLDINNTISHTWITDIYGRQLAVPNYLTGRRINIKLNMSF